MGEENEGGGVQKNPQILSKIVQLYGIYDFFFKGDPAKYFIPVKCEFM